MIKTLKWIYNLGWHAGYKDAVAEARRQAIEMESMDKIINEIKGEG